MSRVPSNLTIRTLRWHAPAKGIEREEKDINFVESKTTPQDAGTCLENKRQKISESVQSLVDKRREEQKIMRLTGSS